MELNRKQNIENKIKEKYANLSEFFIEMTRIAYPDYNPYEYYQKNKGNYSKALSGERSFKEREIIAMEELLLTSFSDLLKNEHNMFVNSGLRYLAHTDDLERAKSVDSNLLKELKYDEYGKTLLDYVLEYKARKIFRVLIGEDKLKAFANYTSFTFFNGCITTGNNNKIIEKEITKFLFELNDKGILEKLFRNNELYKLRIDTKGSLFNYDFFEELLKHEDLVLSLINEDPQRYSFEETNVRSTDSERKGIYVNRLIGILLSDYITLFKDNEKSLIKILNKAIQANELVINYINENKLVVSDFTREGFIKNGNTVIASAYVINIKEELNFSDECNLLIEKLNRYSDELSLLNKTFQDGLSNSGVIIKNGQVIKKSSKNFHEYDFLNFMASKHYQKVPIYFETINNQDHFSFIEGQRRSFPAKCNEEEIKEIVVALKEMHDLEKGLFEEGQVYVHGNLSPQNTIYKENRLVGIIERDNCYVGEPYFDFIYVFWTWSNIGSYYRDNERLFHLLLKMIEAYNPNERFKTNFASKIIDVMDEKLCKTDIKNKDYEKIFQWVKRSQCWVELYRNKIAEFIG